MLCLHHNDADGFCSGAIVKRRFGDALELYEIDYGLPVPWEKVDAAETVIITDFSLPKADMERIHRAKGDNFIWIDHHISAINDMADLPDLSGIRDTNKAACVLTWEYFFQEEPVPHTVHLIGDRDIWRFEYPETKVFCEGLYYFDLDLTDEALWRPMLDDDPNLMKSLIEQGQILYRARMKEIARVVRAYGFETTFHGHNTLAINLPGSGDLGHYMISLGYDIAYVYREEIQADKLITRTTLYSETVDVSILAKARHGGGHRGAAGFHFERAGNSPFPPE